MKKLGPALLLFLLLTACGGQPLPAAPGETAAPPDIPAVIVVPGVDAPEEEITPEPPPDPVAAADALIDGMTLQEQIAQLFIVSLPPGGTPAEEAGGYILFQDDISTWEDTRALTDALRDASEIGPFIAIDEEGGSVSRLYSAGLPGYEKKPAARQIGETGDPAAAYDTAAGIGAALSALGINVNFAPVADILIHPDSTVIGTRAFGSEPALVSDMVSAFSRGLRDQGILAAAKHFPGHGAAAGDSHDGSVQYSAELSALMAAELQPFIRAIGEGIPFILMGHITVSGADSSGLPATLSHYFVTEILREKLGFDGIVITDAMNMGAITARFAPGEAAVMAILAGVDVILMSENFDEAAAAVLTALEDGTIAPERIHGALRRILRTKIEAGIITLGQ